MPAQAPSGGIVSRVNGQFYDGGQFLPDTGKYCGKGKNRISEAEFLAVAEQASKTRYTLVYRDRFQDFALVLSTGLVMFTAKNVRTLAPIIKDAPVNTINVNPW